MFIYQPSHSQQIPPHHPKCLNCGSENSLEIYDKGYSAMDGRPQPTGTDNLHARTSCSKGHRKLQWVMADGHCKVCNDQNMFLFACGKAIYPTPLHPKSKGWGANGNGFEFPLGCPHCGGDPSAISLPRHPSVFWLNHAPHVLYECQSGCAPVMPYFLMMVCGKLEAKEFTKMAIHSTKSMFNGQKINLVSGQWRVLDHRILQDEIVEEFANR